MKLSVLMSVYHKESPEFLWGALNSLVVQTVRADEVVIVKDGPLGDALDAIIASYCGTLPIVTLQLKKKVGLGMALRVGLGQCRGELVARMDSDDICLRHRFEKQLAFLDRNPDVDVVGGVIAEFHRDCGKIESVRRLPCTTEQLNKVARTRNPLNHVTVMLRKASVLGAGNYRSFAGFEDYDLWARMLMRGSRFQNLDDVLVYVRCGNGMQKRRGGVRYLKEEIRLHRHFLKIGFLSRQQFLFNLIARTPIRIAPAPLRAIFYRRTLRHNGFVNQNGPNFDHPIWPPLVNQLTIPGRSEALRRR
jgi:glycosyltransferase involved in cell wall biosynthesis